jgi:biofilm PGA synthesis N-glycosyltransferase PgaC
MVLLACAWAWWRLPSLHKNTFAPKAFFTVIIPVKDEAANIINLLQDLERQTYPKSSYEVLVIDDHSTDGTPSLVEEYLASSALNLRLLFLASFPENRLKKGAIALGVTQAKGEWIACTDGDCRVKENWLDYINQCRYAQDAKLVSGPVTLTNDGSWFQQLQALEFAALIGVGGACIGLHKPTMCNGANLAYEKAAFLAVNGFIGNAHLPSGDDEFLMHKLHQKYPGQVTFLKDPEAIVSTNALTSFTSFIEQRKRWASKWKHYTSLVPQVLALLVLGANVALWLALGLAISGAITWASFAAVVLLKLIPDALLLMQVLGFFQKRKLLLLLGLLQVVYVPYIIATAILGWRGTYAWKDRQHVAS